MTERGFTWFSKEKSEYQPKKEKGVIVEVGPGSGGMALVSKHVVDKIDNDALYIGIDISDESIRSAKRAGRGLFLKADAKAIPLVNDLADEIWISNIFSGSVRIKESEFTQVFSEISRVLKPGGVANIIEYFYPFVELLDDYKNRYKKFGFDAEVFRGGKSREFIEKYGITTYVSAFFEETSHLQPFFMTLTKK